ncbi:aldo/keto reductase [Paenibacillus sp. 1001270B_150601_E10]|uniref:aldo/keto reductase n=1 Tax=Paenibacillus sp. 1001270B_150601_E10 TaxID=2787079 RepID=UPI00189E370D|nr:aldo/keto reductase [Paenibacillus sp. 1001270B_150601_E10]
MNVIPLQQHGFNTSRLVLGCMSFGGGWNNDPITDADMLKAEKGLDAALSIGINMLDHANIYTRGKAEEVFGRIFKAKPELREQLIVQTKCGIRFQEGEVPGRYDFSKEHILSSVDASLKRLNTEYLDILLLHRPDPLMEPSEVAEAFGKLKAQGKVRAFGVSNMSVSQMRFLEHALSEKLIVNQLEMSLSHLHWLDQGVHVNQDAGTGVSFGEGIMEYCQMERVQLQAWGPLSQGRFTGRSVEQEPEHIQRTAALVKQLAEAKETTPEAIVLGWLMRHPAGIQPIIGSGNAERILACQDAEQQAKLMTREEWYALYVAARGIHLP